MKTKSSMLVVVVILLTAVPVLAQATQKTYLPYINLKRPTIEPTITSTPTPEPSKIVEILPNSYGFVSPGGYSHIVGEIENRTDDIISNIRISASLFDSQHNIVGTQSNSVYLDYLEPKEKTCFILPFSMKDLRWEAYEFETPIYQVGENTFPGLNVISPSGSIDNLKWYHLIGQIRNDSDQKAHSVKATGTLYNAEGKSVGCYFDYVNSNDLDAGQTSAFDILFYSRDYSDVASFQIQASGRK